MIHKPLRGQGAGILFTATLVLAVPTQRASSQGTISQLSFLVYLPLPTESPCVGETITSVTKVFLV